MIPKRRRRNWRRTGSMQWLAKILTVCTLLFVAACGHRGDVLISSRHDLYYIKGNRIIHETEGRRKQVVGKIECSDDIDGYFIASPKLMGNLGLDKIND